MVRQDTSHRRTKSGATRSDTPWLNACECNWDLRATFYIVNNFNLVTVWVNDDRIYTFGQLFLYVFTHSCSISQTPTLITVLLTMTSVKAAFHSQKVKRARRRRSIQTTVTHSRLDYSLSLSLQQQQKHLFIAFSLSVLKRNVSKTHSFIKRTASSAFSAWKNIVHFFVSGLNNDWFTTGA